MRSLQPPIPAPAQNSSSSTKDPSAAQTSLRRLHEQTLPGGSQQKKDDVGVKTGEAAAAASPKGKPRLLLMGQRR